jgi:hypothetical protein
VSPSTVDVDAMESHIGTISTETTSYEINSFRKISQAADSEAQVHESAGLELESCRSSCNVMDAVCGRQKTAEGAQHSDVRITAQLADLCALPASEAVVARQCLSILKLGLLPPRPVRRSKTGSKDDASEAALTIVGSWNLVEAKALVASGAAGVVRGVNLLEYCVQNSGRRDLLTRTETPCILNSTLRNDVVCFSGIVGLEKEELVFQVEVFHSCVLWKIPASSFL